MGKFSVELSRTYYDGADEAMIGTRKCRALINELKTAQQRCVEIVLDAAVKEQRRHEEERRAAGVEGYDFRIEEVRTILRLADYQALQKQPAEPRYNVFNFPRFLLL